MMTTPQPADQWPGTLFDSPAGDMPLTVATVTPTARDAQAILDRYGYERQRKLDHEHVVMVANMMHDGEFIEGSDLAFAYDDSGKPALAAGQRRLLVADPADPVHALYTALHVMEERREERLLGRIQRFKQLPQRLQMLALRAARYQNVWDTNYRLPPRCKTPPRWDNVSKVIDMEAAFERVDEIINGPGVAWQIRNPLRSPMVVAVMAETIQHQPDEGRKFWADVAGRENPARMAKWLHYALLEKRRVRARPQYRARLAAHVWNQRGSDRALRRDNIRPLPVDGTRLVIPA